MNGLGKSAKQLQIEQQLAAEFDVPTFVVGPTIANQPMTEHEIGNFPGEVDRKWGAINAPTTVMVDLPPVDERMKCRRCRWVGTLSECRRKPSTSISIRGMTDRVCPRCGCKTFTKEEQSNG